MANERNIQRMRRWFARELAKFDGHRENAVLRVLRHRAEHGYTEPLSRRELASMAQHWIRGTAARAICGPAYSSPRAMRQTVGRLLARGEIVGDRWRVFGIKNGVRAGATTSKLAGRSGQPRVFANAA
jgi:hypothetical protein